MKEKHEDEDDDEGIEDRAGEDLFEVELHDSGSSPAVGRVAELLGLVQQSVKVVLVAGKSEKLIKNLRFFFSFFPFRFFFQFVSKILKSRWQA